MFSPLFIKMIASIMSTFLFWFGIPYSHWSLKLPIELPVINLLEKQIYLHKTVEMLSAF